MSFAFYNDLSRSVQLSRHDALERSGPPLPAVLAVPHCSRRRTLASSPSATSASRALQRITEGTVYNYLPVNIGDTSTISGRVEKRCARCTRPASSATSSCDATAARWSSRCSSGPSIASFTLTGNKDIKTEDLEKSLRNVGLAQRQDVQPVDARRGQALPDGPVLLARQVRACASTPRSRTSAGQSREDRDRHRRRQAREDPPDQRRRQHQALRRRNCSTDFKLKTPNWLSWYRQDDRYSREELSGDIEKLRSYYMDRGYANFDVESTAGGDRARQGRHLHHAERQGRRGLPSLGRQDRRQPRGAGRETCERSIQVHRGDIYSRKMVTQTTEFMALRLGQDGYAFAKIDPVPQENRARPKEIALHVPRSTRATARTCGHIDVQRRRRASTTTCCGARCARWRAATSSNSAVERSKQRLQRLPFIEKVEVETTPVPGTPDLVDVNYDDQGRPAGSVQRRHRLLGVAVDPAERQLRAQQLHGHRQPRRRRDQRGPVQQGVRACRTRTRTRPSTACRARCRRRSDASTSSRSSSSDFQTETGTLSASTTAGRSRIPVAARGHLAAQRSDLFTGPEQRARTEARVLGTRTTATRTRATRRTAGVAADRRSRIYGTKFDTFELSLGWAYDSRNRSLFADRGCESPRWTCSYTLPGSDVEFYTFELRLPAVPAGLEAGSRSW